MSDLRNIVHGVNHDEITDNDTIVSAWLYDQCNHASLSVLLRSTGTNGPVETVHSYTNDQNLIITSIR